MQQSKKVVIVEDNPYIREGFASVLEGSDDYVVAGQYGNVESAIESLHRDRPDVVLMDIGLPGINGIEGTAMIKKLMPGCLVIIITVMDESEKVFRSLCAGATGYIVKNSDQEQIIETIDEALSGGAPMSFSIARMVVQSFQQSMGSPLSQRETDVLNCIAEGKTYSKIADDLCIGKETVRTHIKSIYLKLSVNSKAQALKIAGEKKWLGRNGSLFL